MSQWDYKIDQPMPGPFPFPNLRKLKVLGSRLTIYMKHVSRRAPILIGGDFDCPAGFSVIIEHCSVAMVL